ncbi:conserved hypothetical protein [Flavobacterium sp. 9AF]|uniref:hypothetical protein n=1 Tax=Flavobacterium sp. 9AF TaxID=2653142 RepID=UPI0012EFFE17|nr:hypothetical protein [Flavobacterium sp. 9AF]VXB53098.1 conserved hypothetical protein [Flavobacterium sp. 9AF]
MKIKHYLFFTFFILLIACNNSGYQFIRDNLYADANGNLYLKSLNNEDVENTYDIWIKEVFCDTCFVYKENGIDSITELKDIVDIKTFHFDSIDEITGVTIYADKNYSYLHKWMADGGTIVVMKR